MYWFRRHQQRLLHLTLVPWVLSVAVMAIEGCWVQPNHTITAPHVARHYVVEDHAQHTSGCLQHCQSTAAAIKPALQPSVLDLLQRTALSLFTAVVIMVLGLEVKSSFAALALKRPPPLEGPVRLIFVRLNDLTCLRVAQYWFAPSCCVTFLRLSIPAYPPTNAGAHHA